MQEALPYLNSMAPAVSPPNLLMADLVPYNVKPSQMKAHVETIDATLLDGFFVDLMMPTLFAYRLGNKSEEAYVQFLDRLKESLQKVLVPFFPFAGRWIPILDGRGRQLLCNDEGVSFMEASVGRDLDSVVRASAEFQPVPELQGRKALGLDSPQFKAEMIPAGLPAVFVQVTRFKCGGVVLGVTFNHMTCDGKAFYEFMTAWSDIARTNQTTIKPNLNRGLAKSFEDVVPIGDPSQIDGEPLNNASVPDTQWLGKAVMKAFEVSASTIQSLKAEASGASSNEGPSYITTADCIVAHMWRNLARLPSSIRKGKEVKVSSAVEGRMKFYDTPLPHLCGNVLSLLFCPDICTSELLEKPLFSIAQEVRKNLLTTRREAWFSSDRLTEMSGTKFASWSVSNWSAFPMYDIDFGVGKPFLAVGLSGVNDAPNENVLGTSIICPPLPASSHSSVATVYVHSTTRVLEALEADPDFNSLFLDRKCNRS